MKIILLIALVSLLAMYLCYPKVCSFVRVFNAAPGEEGAKGAEGNQAAWGRWRCLLNRKRRLAFLF